ncbi:catalase [Cupriavidus basilensis]
MASAQRDLFENIREPLPARWICARWSRRSRCGKRTATSTPFRPGPSAWPTRTIRLIDVGVLESLAAARTGTSPRVERVAMNPSNVVPGIGFSPDKMLQGAGCSHVQRRTFALSPGRESRPDSGRRAPHNARSLRVRSTATAAMRADGNRGRRQLSC